MAKQTWVVTDVEQDVYLESLALSPGNVKGKATGYSVSKRTLRGGLRDGVDVIEVNNGRFQFVVVPTRGMGLWNARQGDVRLGWRSPVQGPVHPALVNLFAPSGIGWLDGFDEWLVRCGLESNGAPEFNDQGAVKYPLHGRIANQPAHRVEVTIDGDAGEIAVTGVVDEARLFGNKLRLSSTISTRVGQPGATITDVVSNRSAEPGELELLYHINFGAPLAEAGAKAVLPIRKMAPRDAVAVTDLAEWDTYGRPSPGSAEAVFFFELAGDRDGATRALLHNAAADRGVSLRFNLGQLPYFALWKNRQAIEDGYVTGLEPAINFPNRKSFEKQMGRVAVLGPGESRSFEIAIEAHSDAAAVEAARKAVADLQARSPAADRRATARGVVGVSEAARESGKGPSARDGERSMKAEGGVKLLDRHRWMVFVLPFAVYMLVGALEPKAETETSASWLSIPYSFYPMVYTLRIALTLAAVAFVGPGYRAFRVRPRMMSVVVGIVGVVVWVGLAELQLEQRLLGPLGLGGFVDSGARSAYNPFVQMSADRWAWAWAFLAVRFFGLVAVVPLVEEFFLRGFLMRFFVQQQWWEVPIGSRDGVALVIAVAAYPVLSHPAEALAAIAWFSLVTWLVMKTRNIWDAVVAHAVTNLLLGVYVVVWDRWHLM